MFKGGVIFITHVYYEIRLGSDFKKLERRLSHMSLGSSDNYLSEGVNAALMFINSIVSKFE
jgi:hypothetical protein